MKTLCQLMIFMIVSVVSASAFGNQGQNLVIQSAVIDYELQQLRITGFDLLPKGSDKGASLETIVQVNEGIPLNVVAGTPNELLLDFSVENFNAGDYILTVKTGKGPSQQDKWNLTLGAIGPQGDRGDEGPQGERGIQGEKGDRGDAGPQGEQGIQGEKGDRGETGPRGGIGSQGEPGPAGPAGERGVGGSGCSVTQEGSNAVIECGDQSTAVLAGAGTVFVLPEGSIWGESPSITIPSGEIVWMDANDVVLGLSFGQFIGLDVGIQGARIGNDHQSPVLTGNQRYPLYYLEQDCSGPAFITRVSYLHDIDNRYLVRAPDSPVNGKVLFKGIRGTGYSNGNGYRSPTACSSGDFVISGSVITVEYVPASEILNATYPIRIEQLP